MTKKNDFIQVSIQSEADLFGFTYHLSNYLGLKVRPKTITTFAHGWNPFEARSVERYFCTEDEDIKLVQNKAAASFLRSNGIEAYDVGLPFINFTRFYSEIYERQLGSVLITARHSHPHFEYEPVICLEKLASWAKQQYEVVSFLVPPKDLEVYYEKVGNINGIKLIPGAQFDDAESFPRIYKAFSEHETLLTTAYGSQLIYGASCGMRVSILEDFFEAYSREDFAENPWYIKYPHLVDEILSDYTFENLSEKFPDMIFSKNKDGIGFEHHYFSLDRDTTDPHILAKLLGWNVGPSHLKLSNETKLKVFISAFLTSFRK